MRKYLAVIWADVTSPFREWTLQGVGLFVAFFVVAGAVVLSAMAAIALPWYAVARFALGYSDERAREIATGGLIVTGAALMYAVSVIERVQNQHDE